MQETKTIAQTNDFIILDKFTKLGQVATQYQTEADLEREFISDLINQGYEYAKNIKEPDDLLNNAKTQLELLNNVTFSVSEWDRFVVEYLNKPNESIEDVIGKIHTNHKYDFKFDNGELKNIYLIDKVNITKNKLQVINQFEQIGKYKNIYDVSILVNGLPLVHIELKKRGISIKEAFNQTHRYSKESLNSKDSMFKHLQIFVISNGTYSLYFANTIKREKSSFDFTINWALEDNEHIDDIKEFTATFFQKNTLLKILINYTVYDVLKNLLIMRPYQIAATERILWKINTSYQNKSFCKPESGGYIWHTTGSGKTLTSFKTAKLATELDFIKKYFLWWIAKIWTIKLLKSINVFLKIV